MKSSADTSIHADLLHGAGLRVTEPRLRILSVLEKNSEPLSVAQVRKLVRDSLDQVTIYRTLESLHKAGVVRQVNLEHDHAHFELATREHHHHAVCKNCGRVEDIRVPHASNITDVALKQTKNFSAIDSYSLEFFGLCKKCAK